MLIWLCCCLWVVMLPVHVWCIYQFVVVCLFCCWYFIFSFIAGSTLMSQNSDIYWALSQRSGAVLWTGRWAWALIPYLILSPPYIQPRGFCGRKAPWKTARAFLVDTGCQKIPTVNHILCCRLWDAGALGYVSPTQVVVHSARLHAISGQVSHLNSKWSTSYAVDG